MVARRPKFIKLIDARTSGSQTCRPEMNAPATLLILLFEGPQKRAFAVCTFRMLRTRVAPRKLATIHLQTVAAPENAKYVGVTVGKIYRHFQAGIGCGGLGGPERFPCSASQSRQRVQPAHKSWSLFRNDSVFKEFSLAVASHLGGALA